MEKSCSAYEIFKFLCFNHPVIYQITDVMMNIEPQLINPPNLVN